MEASYESARPSRAWLGSLTLFLGVVLLVLCAIEAGSETGLPRMPRAWHVNREMWWGLGILAVGGGCWMLAPQPVQTIDWKPTRPGIRFQQVQLYTRQGCHLCDEAVSVLDQHHRWLPRIVVIDVDTEPRLIEKYGTCVPVVVCDGKVRFRGGVPAELLRRLLEGTPPV